MSKFGFLVLSVVVLSVTAAIPALAQNAPAENTPAAATPATAPTRVSSADQEKKLTKKVNPSYPKEAYDAKLTGIISLETTIGVDGKVTNVRLIGKGEDLLVKAAMDAVKQWVYKPTKDKAGKPIEVVTIVTLNFKVGE